MQRFQRVNTQLPRVPQGWMTRTLLSAYLKGGSRSQSRVIWSKTISECSMWFEDTQRHLPPPGRRGTEGMGSVSWTGEAGRGEWSKARGDPLHVSISSKKCNRGPMWVTVHSSRHSNSNYSRFQEEHKVCIRLSVAPGKKSDQARKVICLQLHKMHISKKA